MTRKNQFELVTASLNNQEEPVWEVTASCNNQEKPVWASHSQYKPASVVMHNNQEEPVWASDS